MGQWGDGADPASSFRIYTRAASDDEWDTLRQNYRAFPDPGGRCDVLEVSVALRNHSPSWSLMRLGVPAARMAKAKGRKCGTHDARYHHARDDDAYDIIVCFTGPSLALYVDGVLVDEDWPVGRL